MDAAFQGVQDEDGIDDEEFYPYEGVDDKECRYEKSHRAADDSGFKTVPEGDEKGKNIKKNKKISVSRLLK